VKNENQALPLARANQACFVIVTGVRGTPLGREFADEVRARTPAARIVPIDPQVSAADLEQIATSLSPCPKVVAANFANGPWLGHLPAFLEQMLARRQPVILVSLSNPYLLASFPQVSAYLATFSTSTASESAAVRALYGEVPATARPPVTLLPAPPNP
jgi:beta-N-acetylhexosaminidase